MRKRRYSEKRNTSDHLVPIASPTPLANLSLKSVLLYDWWLCTADPGGLAIGGFECRGRQGQRVLCSAAITKRHDATTLETADGVTVAISGFINASRTLENGFSPKVCNANSFPTPSLGKLPVPAARVRDLLVLSAGDYRKSVSDHMLRKLSPHDSAADGENSNCQKNNKFIEKDIDDDNDNMSHSRSKTPVKSENEDQSRIGVGSTTQTIGVKTRSMTRLKEKGAGLCSSVSDEKALQRKSTAK